jgi:hypothetical protein
MTEEIKKFTYLNPVDPKEFSKLYEMLEKIKLPIKQGKTIGRANFTEKHRACSWGMSYHFTRHIIHEKSLMSKKYPEIHDELMRIGRLICHSVCQPFTTIYMNKNIQCDPHKDTSNHGDLIIVSFGEYEGGDLIIEGERACAKYHPILFDGAKYEHWNPKDLVGTKYSLVFFCHKAIIRALEAKNSSKTRVEGFGLKDHPRHPVEEDENNSISS